MEQQKMNYVTAFGFLWRYASKYKRNFIRFYLGFLFDTILQIAIPIVSGIMVDEIVYFQNVPTFLRLGLVYLVMLVFSCTLYFFIYAQHHYLMNIFTMEIKRDLFAQMQKSDAQFLTDASSGDLVHMIYQYGTECMYFMVRNVSHQLNNLLLIAAIVVYLFVIDWRMGLFLAFAAPVSVAVSMRFGKKVRRLGEQEREYYSGYMGWVFERLSGLRDLRMLGGTGAD